VTDAELAPRLAEGATEQPYWVTVKSAGRPSGPRLLVVQPAATGDRPSPVAAWVKRAFDVVIATLAVLLLLPVFAIVAIAVLVAEGRPVIYRHTRVGRDGRAFTMLKFRSMVPDAHDRLYDLRPENQRGGPLFKLHRDPRVTRVGRVLRTSSLDELPQLFNVLGGSMSLVGPRPALYEERANFPPDLLEREKFRPGITGLWQVEARLDPSFERYHDLDLEYVRSHSFWRDLGILLRTPFVVVRDMWRWTRNSQAIASADHP
jgi:lipopolysaccharide/colanic/teichoic acid biosynthesis glycosyltransferase